MTWKNTNEKKRTKMGRAKQIERKYRLGTCRAVTIWDFVVVFVVLHFQFSLVTHTISLLNLSPEYSHDNGNIKWNDGCYKSYLKQNSRYWFLRSLFVSYVALVYVVRACARACDSKRDPFHRRYFIYYIITRYVVSHFRLKSLQFYSFAVIHMEMFELNEERRGTCA